MTWKYRRDCFNSRERSNFLRFKWQLIAFASDWGRWFPLRWRILSEFHPARLSAFLRPAVIRKCGG